MEGCHILMIRTVDNVTEFLREAPEDKQPLGNYFSELAVDVNRDSVKSVRELHRQI